MLMKQLLIVLMLSGMLSACSHWSDQIEKSPCACDFSLLNSHLV